MLIFNNLGFQFLGIPPKGELLEDETVLIFNNLGFQFLGIPPKGEREGKRNSNQVGKGVSNF